MSKKKSTKKTLQAPLSGKAGVSQARSFAERANVAAAKTRASHVTEKQRAASAQKSSTSVTRYAPTKKLGAYREKLSLSQSSIWKTAGTSIGRLERSVERGDATSVNVSVVERLAKALQLSLKEAVELGLFKIAS